MEIFLSICLGLGLAAACGFRVFVPLLAISIAANSGHLTLAPAFQWIGTTPALIAFGVATALEIAGYYIPWVDHFLDTVATPAAVVAGTIVTAAMLTNVSPFLQWTLAVIAGGGLAAMVQSGTVLTRALSTTSSGGLANPVVASAELGMSGFLSFISLSMPILGALLVIGLIAAAATLLYKRFASKKPPAGTLA